MKFNKYLICALFLVLICCIGAASAAEADDVVAVNDTIDEAVSEAVDVSDEVVDDSLGVSEEPALSDGEDTGSSEKVIYVGTNSTIDGRGTEDDPYATLELACNNYNAGEQKDTVNVIINDGTYYIGSYLKFNTNNLNIIGNGHVTIKNLYNDKGQSFGSNCNFSMSNIIFNASNFASTCSYSQDEWFTPFIGNNADIIFDNCTFADYCEVVDGLYNYILPVGVDWNAGEYVNLFENDNIVFNSCQFVGSRGMCVANIEYPCKLIFNYCNFGGKFSNEGFGIFKNGATVIFDSCWLGHNNGYTNAFFDLRNYAPGHYGEIGFNYRADFLKDSLFANRHAILDVSENYLGDNVYEIIGKLMWNDGTNDNIDKLGSMIVYLSADNGNIPSTATLENGTFNVTYTSDSDYHEITVELDSQKIKLNNKINFTLNAPTITYGDNQNITVTFPTKVNGTVYVTVNNNTYHSPYVDDQNNVTVSIDDILYKGIYPVDVYFACDKNEFDVVVYGTSHAVEEIDSFGFNTTQLTVNGLSDYEFNSTVTPNSLYIGDNATVTLSLPEGANGTVTIKVGDNEAKTFNVNETITIDGFVTGDNVVNITYNGNDIYDAKSIVKTVVASTKPTALVASDVTTTYNVTKELVITLTSNGDALANKKINVVVGSINKTLTTNANGQVSLDISSLTPNNYTANIAFAGDELYNKSSTTAKVTVKEEIKTNITIPEITAGKATTTTIKLPQNATGNITVIVDGNVTGVENLTNGSATVIIPELSTGKHNITISYSGDDNYAGFAQTSAVEVKEPAKPTTQPDNQKSATTKKTATKITAKKKTFKAKTKVKKYTITLKAGKKAVKKVQVTLKIGKKTFKAKTNAKGKATFKIKKLTKKGKYNAKITFKGNKLYKASSKKVKITVKK